MNVFLETHLRNIFRLIREENVIDCLFGDPPRNLFSFLLDYRGKVIEVIERLFWKPAPGPVPGLLLHLCAGAVRGRGGEGSAQALGGELKLNGGSSGVRHTAGIPYKHPLQTALRTAKATKGQQSEGSSLLWTE